MKWWRFAAVAVLSLGLAGCAISFKDENGQYNHVGLMWVKHSGPNRPVIVQVTNVGLGLQLGKTSGFLLGYEDQILVTPRAENAVYDIDFDVRAPFLTTLTVQSADLGNKQHTSR